MALLSQKEISRIAPYTSNSFDMLDSISMADHQDGYSPAPVNSSSTPPQVGKKKKKHKSNKSTQFTPPQSPVAQQRRRSLTPVDQNVSYRQPLSPSVQPRRMENYSNFPPKQYSTNKRRSLISRSPEDYRNNTNSIHVDNKENRAPSVVSGNSSSSEQKSSRSERGDTRAKTSKEDTKDLPESKPSFSIWDYLKDELTASDFDSAQDLKRERVTNLLGVPGAVEKVDDPHSLQHNNLHILFTINFFSAYVIWTVSLLGFIPIHVHHIAFTVFLCACVFLRSFFLECIEYQDVGQKVRRVLFILFWYITKLSSDLQTS
jgi:hypothetical protein